MAARTLLERLSCPIDARHTVSATLVATIGGTPSVITSVTTEEIQTLGLCEDDASTRRRAARADGLRAHGPATVRPHTLEGAAHGEALRLHEHARAHAVRETARAGQDARVGQLRCCHLQI